MNKLARIIILPTDKAVKGYNLFKLFDDSYRVQLITEDAKVEEFSSTFKRWEPSYVYITDNSTIKIGDWFIVKDKLEKCTALHDDDLFPYIESSNGSFGSIHCRKVIGSSDSKVLSHDTFFIDISTLIEFDYENNQDIILSFDGKNRFIRLIENFKYTL